MEAGFRALSCRAQGLGFTVRAAAMALLLLLLMLLLSSLLLRMFTFFVHCSSFLWFIFRVLEGNPRKELLWSLRVIFAFN